MSPTLRLCWLQPFLMLFCSHFDIPFRCGSKLCHRRGDTRNHLRHMGKGTFWSLNATSELQHVRKKSRSVRGENMLRTADTGTIAVPFDHISSCAKAWVVKSAGNSLNQ